MVSNTRRVCSGRLKVNKRIGIFDIFPVAFLLQRTLVPYFIPLLSTKKSKSFFEIVVKSVNSRDFEVKRI